MHLRVSGGVRGEKAFLNTVPAGTKVDLSTKARRCAPPARERVRAFCGVLRCLWRPRGPILGGGLQRPAALEHHARERKLVQHPIAGWPEGPRVSQCQRQR